MTQPYRTLDLCERMSHVHGKPKSVEVQVWKSGWRWGPIAGGRIQWGEELYSVIATPWCSFWWRCSTKATPR